MPYSSSTTDGDRADRRTARRNIYTVKTNTELRRSSFSSVWVFSPPPFLLSSDDVRRSSFVVRRQQKNVNNHNTLLSSPSQVTSVRIDRIGIGIGIGIGVVWCGVALSQKNKKRSVIHHKQTGRNNTHNKTQQDVCMVWGGENK